MSKLSSYNLSMLLYIPMIFTAFSTTCQINIDSINQEIRKLDADSLVIQQYGNLIKEKAVLESDYVSILKSVWSSALSDSMKLAIKLDVASSLSVKGYPDLAKAYYKQIQKSASELNFYDLVYESRMGDYLFLSDDKPDQAIEAYLGLLKDTAQLTDRRLITSARIELASIQRTKGEPELALLNLDTAIQTLKQFPLDNNSIRALLLKGRIFRRVGDTDRSKESYLAALKLCDEHNLGGKAKILNNLGNIEHVEGRLDKAVELYVKSLELKRADGDKKGMAMSFFNIGAIKSDMKQFDEAQKDFDKAVALAEETGNKRLVIRCISRQGSAHQDQGEYDKAIELQTKVIKLSKEINFNYGIMAAQYHLGEVYRLTDDISKAFELYQLALIQSRDQRHAGYEGAILAAIAQAYARQNEIRTTDAGENSDPIDLTEFEIRQLLLQSKTIAENTNNFENKLETYAALDVFYENTNEYKKHLDVLQKLMSLKDSLFTKEKTEAIIGWEEKYHAAEKEMEIAKLESDQEIATLKQNRLRNLYIATVLFLAGLGTFLYFYFVQKQAIKATKQSELFRSKLSSDLHDDVGSILTGVAMQSELLMLKSPNENTEIYEKLAAMSREAMGVMRDTVWAIDSRKDTFEDLIDRIQDFADDTLPAAGKSLILKNRLDKNKLSLKPDVRQAVYLIFKEAITNAVKYSDTKTIETTLSIENNDLKLYIKDFGQVDPAGIKTSGTGLSNMKLRAERLGGQMKHFVDQGFHLDIQIPL